MLRILVVAASCMLASSVQAWPIFTTPTTPSTRAPFGGDFVMIYLNPGAVVSTAYDNLECTKGCNFLTTRLPQTLRTYANAGYDVITSSTSGVGSQELMIVYILKKHN